VHLCVVAVCMCVQSAQLYKWVPGNNWGSKCQTAMLMGVIQVGPRVPTGNIMGF